MIQQTLFLVWAQTMNHHKTLKGSHDLQNTQWILKTSVLEWWLMKMLKIYEIEGKTQSTVNTSIKLTAGPNKYQSVLQNIHNKLIW